MRPHLLSTLVVFLVCGFAVVPEAAAQGGDVEDVAVSSTVPNSAAVLALRQALAGAVLRSPDAQDVPVLSVTGSVTRLERVERGGRVRLCCEISIVAFDRNGGQMRAMLTGLAESTVSSPESASDARLQEEGVIRTAVASALRRLWQTLS